jgi:hypothetical protein
LSTPPPPPPPYPGPQPPPYPVVPPPYGGQPLAPMAPTDGGATASLVLGILGAIGAFLCWPIGLVLGILGLVMGLRARSRIRAAAGQLAGDGMALWGAIVGGIGAGMALVFLALTVVYFGIIIAAISSGAIRPSPSP